jgi:hypothetical protein
LITSTLDTKRNLTIYTCKGQILAGEIMEAVKFFYDNSPSLNVIWDLTDADVSRISADEIRALASGVKRLAHSREGGITAIVSPSEVSYGFVRMYQIFAEIYSHIARIEAFRSKSEAERWISEQIGTSP